MAHMLPFPCPVALGTIRDESFEAQLHENVKLGNHVKVKKLLKKGISADAVNSLGQTPLFTASLLGLGKLVDVLLDYGSDPNHRCYDGSTPVHAAAFSGNQSILSKLLDAGGDLRAHDKNGRNPQNWAETAGKETSTQVLDFIRRCTVHMQATVQSYSLDLLRKVDSPRALVSSPSKFAGLGQGSADNPLGRLLKRGNSASQKIYSFGFGKFRIAGSRQLGYLASLPIIGEKDIVQADDEATFSFPAGPYMSMTNLVWCGSRVTVKELSVKPHQHCSNLRLSDLLLAEREYSSKLLHHHLLQLMAVCLSEDLEKIRLVFERVQFGSLYSILHERRAEFPSICMETIVHMLLQLNDALRFLHLRGFIHRTISSYAVMIVLPGEAKLANFEYMIESKDGGEHSDLTRVPIPSQLYKWCAPEVVLEKAATVKSDIYSFCAVMQEALTDTLPWDGRDGSSVKDLIVSGQWLEVDPRLPKPYYDIVKTGLESRQSQRTMNLQAIRYILNNDLKDLLESRRSRPGERSGPPKTEVRPDINIYLPPTLAAADKIQELEEKETVQSAKSYALTRCALSAPEIEGIVVRRSEPALRIAQSTPHLAPAAKPQDNGSDTDESLCSFEINEIYTCYSELCEESGAEEAAAAAAGTAAAAVAATGEELAARRESQTIPGDRTEVTLPPPAESPPRPVCVEGAAAPPGHEEEPRGEEESVPSKPFPVQQVVTFVSRGSGANSQSLVGYHFGKCVLNLKISQTLLQQATDAICRTEEKLDAIEIVRKKRSLLLSENHGEQDGNALRNITAPCTGARAFLWKAVGPPSKNYIFPSFHVPGTYQPVVIQSYQTLEEEPRSQHTACWSCVASEPVHSLEDRGGTEPNYQFLHPGVSVRKKKSPQIHRTGSMLDGMKAPDGFCPELNPPVNEASISEERRMAQYEWTAEVKEMAKKAASGQLGLPPPYPPSKWALQDEVGTMKDTFPNAAPREQLGLCHWNPGGGRMSLDPRLGSEKACCNLTFEVDPGTMLVRRLGPAIQSLGQSSFFPVKEIQAEGGLILNQKATSATIKGFSQVPLQELEISRSSSVDISEEFLTPDAEFFLASSPAPANSELENSSVFEEDEEEYLETTEGTLGPSENSHETLGQLDCPINPEQRQKFPHRTEVKNFRSQIPEDDPLTPVASARGKQDVGPNEARPGESKEKDVSLIDIQDLSSISCEDSCKQTAPKTPKSTHTPTKASTPISPEPRKYSSTIVKYKDYCVTTIDMTSWAGLDSSSQASSFFTACEAGKPQGALPARLSEANVSSESAFLLPHERSEKESEVLFLSTHQHHPQKAASRKASLRDEPEAEVTLSRCRANCNLWTSEMSTGEDTERAHSTLDYALEHVLGAAAKSCDLPDKSLDPIKRDPSYRHHGNVEMKEASEEMLSESEGSAENIDS